MLLAELYEQLTAGTSGIADPGLRPNVRIRAELSAAATIEGAALEWISDPIRLARMRRLLRSTALEQHQHIAVLSTAHDSPADQIAAGSALQRIRLTADGYGLAPTTPPCPMDRHELRRLVRDPRRGWIEPHGVLWFGADRLEPSSIALEEFLLDATDPVHR